MQECALNRVLDCNYVVKLEEIIVHNERIHAFFELMDRDMSSLPFVYNEDFCKYSIYCVAKGLQIMHSKNILHRDLKSENILCNEKGEVKLADLGLSVFLTDERCQRNTLQGGIVFYAPELAKNENYGKEIDVWALGCFAFELATGLTPFQQRTEYGTLNAILSNHAAPSI